jgi:hypothetical protein
MRQIKHGQSLLQQIETKRGKGTFLEQMNRMANPTVISLILIHGDGIKHLNGWGYPSTDKLLVLKKRLKSPHPLRYWHLLLRI